MLKIGEFAILADMSIKTLRYYDDIGLLKPVFVDPDTGYRYYDYSQLAQAYRLTSFKGMGLALNEIAQLFEGKMTPGPTRRFLRTKRDDLSDQVRILREQIAYLDNKIYEVEIEGRMSHYEIMVKRLEPMKAIIARGVAPRQKDVGHVIANLRQQVAQYNVVRTAPDMAIFPAYIHPPENIPLEVAQPTDNIIQFNKQDHVEEILIPAMTVASVIHTGASDMSTGWVALNEWIQRNGYKVAGAFREIFLHDDTDNTDQLAYELQFPIEKIKEN